MNIEQEESFDRNLCSVELSQRVLTAQPVGDSSKITYHDHGIGMFVAWGVLSWISFASVRWLKYFYRISIALHALSGLTMVVLTSVFGWWAFQKADFKVINSTHTIIGFTITCSVIVLLLLGWATSFLKVFGKRKTCLMLVIKKIHGFFGFILAILA